MGVCEKLLKQFQAEMHHSCTLISQLCGKLCARVRSRAWVSSIVILFCQCWDDSCIFNLLQGNFHFWAIQADSTDIAK